MVVAIWACNEANVIGDGEKLLWDIPEDLKFFKEKTLNQNIVMGRRTWESLPFKPLPGRTNIVLSSQQLELPEGVKLVTSLKEARTQFGNLVIIGGGTLYAEALPATTVIYRTLVSKDIPTTEGLVYAPEVLDEFSIRSDTGWRFSEKEQLEYKHQVLLREQY